MNVYQYFLNDVFNAFHSFDTICDIMRKNFQIVIQTLFSITLLINLLGPDFIFYVIFSVRFNKFFILPQNQMIALSKC